MATVLGAATLIGCGAEKHAVGPAAPLSAPVSLADPRAKQFETNAYQVSEGGRMFRWQGCDGCHTERSTGAALLTDGVWSHGGTTPEIYTSIAEGRPGMAGYGGRIVPEQIWQIAGYLHGLSKTPMDKRTRQSSDLKGEPQGAQWAGALP